eukprot:1288221-Amphidinium_carterae.1
MALWRYGGAHILLCKNAPQSAAKRCCITLCDSPHVDKSHNAEFTMWRFAAPNQMMHYLVMMQSNTTFGFPAALWVNYYAFKKSSRTPARSSLSFAVTAVCWLWFAKFVVVAVAPSRGAALE